MGELRAATPARIGLARAGAATATRETLAFQAAHARARDAVEAPFDADGLAAAIAARGLKPLRLKSRAGDLSAYLARPDLGRALDDASRALLARAEGLRPRLRGRRRPVGAIADAARAGADRRRAAGAAEGWRVGPVAVVERGRVAIGDEIGAASMRRWSRC